MNTAADLWKEFPVLQTPRLILREITLEDADDYFSIYSDPEVMRFWSSPPQNSIDQSIRRIEGIREDVYNGQGIRWAITLKPSNRLIGSVGHWRWMKEHFRTEIGYELALPYWGQGIMAEAVRAVVQYGFDHMELNSVEAHTHPDNIGSMRVLEKLGFQREGYQRENFCVEGVFSDTVLFGLLKREFIQNR